MEKAIQRVAFMKKPYKIVKKINLPKYLRSSGKATYEFYLEFTTYEEDEEDNYSVVMSVENIERRVNNLKNALGNEEINLGTTENDVMEELKSFSDLINSLNNLVIQPT